MRGSLLRPAARRLVLLTGQSDPRRTDLSVEQAAFLDHVAPPGVEVVRDGFPWLAATRGRAAAPLWRACLSNARQLRAARGSLGFQGFLQARVGDLLDTTAERLVVVTGSCGLELLRAGWPVRGPEAPEPKGYGAARRPGPAKGEPHADPPRMPRRTLVIALGPVAAAPVRLPGAALVTLRGARDGWSRALHRAPVDHATRCGHLGYWTCAETAAIVRRLVREATA